MQVKGKSIGFALTGSHCTYEEIWPEIERLTALGANVHPIASSAVANTDTRFGNGADIIKKFEELTGKKTILTIVEAEPIGPKDMFDIVIIAPCTGNTTARLANAINDGPVTMAAKAHLRNGKPLVLAISTNDALGLNARNIGTLISTKNIYFVPFGQDNPEKKPNSLVSNMELIVPTIEQALEHKQIQPVIIERSVRVVK